VPAKTIVAAERIAVADDKGMGHRPAIVAKRMGRRGALQFRR
jgi:hypothetical protein